MIDIRRWMLVLTGMGAVGLSACVTYRPQPLKSADVEQVLQSPDRAQLVQGAGSLHHPLLEPIKLDFSQPLTGEEIAVIAVLANPDLRALRLQQGVADAQVFAAGLLPDPQVGLGFDKLLSPKNQGFSDAYAGSVTLDVLGALVTRPVEKQTATAAADQVRDEISWEEWSTAGQARLLAVRWIYQSRARELAHQAADLADQALVRALRLAGSGDLADDDIQVQRLAAADARDKALAADHTADNTRLDLNQILGLKPEETLSLAPPAGLAGWQRADVDNLFATARDRRLDLAALRRGYDSQEASLHRAILGQYPRLGITINRASDTSAVHTLGPAVTFDLPLWNRNRGAIAVEKADRTRLRAEYAARLHQTRSDIAALVQALDRDERAREVLEAQIPAILSTSQHLTAAYTRHDVTLTTAEAAQATALDKQMALLALQQSCAEERIGLALATGEAMSNFLEGT